MKKIWGPYLMPSSFSTIFPSSLLHVLPALLAPLSNISFVFSLFLWRHHNLSSSPRALHSPPSPSFSLLLSDAKLFNKEPIRVCLSEGSWQTVLGWFQVFLFVSSRSANLKLSIWIQELCLGLFFFFFSFFEVS